MMNEAAEQSAPVLERERIYHLLARAMDGDALLLVAGQGYGKTTAVRSFLRKRPEMSLWRQMSVNGNLRAFWENFAQLAGQKNAGAAAQLREMGFPKTEAQFDKWMEISAAVFKSREKLILVLDDFHLLKSRKTLEFVNRSFCRPMPGIFLILICRTEPELHTISLISKGRLARIGAEELIFTRDETAEYFRLLDIPVSESDIAAIQNDTEGWPLLVGIAAADMQKRGNRKNMFQHYADSLFHPLPKEFQNYFIKLSFFEKWPLDLMDRISGLLPKKFQGEKETAIEKLNPLIHYDYFLPGYRFHGPFLEYLRKKQRGLPQGEIKEISETGAQWCLDNNLLPEAAAHFERSENYEEIAAIADSFSHTIPSPIADPLLKIVNRIIEKKKSRQGKGSADYLDYLECIIRPRLIWHPNQREYPSMIYHDNISRFTDLPATPMNTRILAESWHALGNLAFVARRCDNSDTYIQCLEKAEYYYFQNPYPVSGAITLNYIGTYVNQAPFPAAAGELERQLNVLIENLPRAANSFNEYLCGVEELGRAELSYYCGDLDLGEQYARAAVIRTRENNQYEIEARSLFLLMKMFLHRQAAGGNIDELLQLWKQISDSLKSAAYVSRFKDSTRYPIRLAMNDIIDGWMYIHLGQLHKIPPWLRGSLEKSELFSVYHNYECLVKAKYFFAKEEYNEAIAILDLPENRKSLGYYLIGHIEMECLKAVSLYRMDDKKSALVVLENAYNAASPNNIIIPFIELGSDMNSLAAYALNAHEGGEKSTLSRPWLETVYRLSSAYSKNVSVIAGQLRDRTEISGKVYLTRRELAVLKGLSLGQTREEIAAETGQPLSTIKSQISLICEKLDAVNRADAVRIASGLGIL